MGLADHEKRELEAIAHHLEEDDPNFATKLSKPLWRAWLSGTTLFVFGLLATYTAGLVGLAAGVTLSSWPLIAVSVAVVAIYPVKVVVALARKRN